MDKYLKLVWFIVTITSWISFGFASWEWADSFDRGMFTLMILWFVISVILLVAGLRLRKSSS